MAALVRARWLERADGFPGQTGERSCKALPPVDRIRQAPLHSLSNLPDNLLTAQEAHGVEGKHESGRLPGVQRRVQERWEQTGKAGQTVKTVEIAVQRTFTQLRQGVNGRRRPFLN